MGLRGVRKVPLDSEDSKLEVFTGKWGYSTRGQQRESRRCKAPQNEAVEYPENLRNTLQRDYYDLLMARDP